MKKILSMFLALTLAASCVVIANAEGMKTSQGLVAPRGASVTITEKNGIKTNVFDYDYANQENPNLARPNMYQAHQVVGMEMCYSLGLDSDGLIVAKNGYVIDDAHELFNPNTTHSDVIYKGIDVGSMYTYNSAKNEYLINSYEQSATFDKETGLFTITDTPSTNVFLASSFGEKSFGITTETNFIMPENGKLDLKNGIYEDMKFEFTGDDLVLVYIDGVRVLNGSTQWYKMYEQNDLTSINFATGVVKTRIDKNETGETSLYKKFSDYCDEMEYDSQKKAAFLADKFEQNAAGQYIFKKGTVHSFKMFYAETGSGLVKNESNTNKSNNYTRFNLISTKEAVKEFTDIPVAENTGYTLIFMNDQLNVGTEIYKVIENYEYDSIDLVADVADTDFEESYLPFAGWFTNKNAAISGLKKGSNFTANHVDTAYAYPYHVKLADYIPSGLQEQITIEIDGEYKTYTENYVVFYAGWVPEIKHKQDTDDANDYGYTDGNVDGFKLHGVQIRSKEISDRYQDENRNTDEDALRFVTSYGIDFIDELTSLNGTPAKYGYTLYAKTNPDDLTANITSKTSGAYDMDCTRTGDRNHHYYEEKGYLLSTVVVKYDTAESKAHMGRDIEARAYVKYTDANGNERYNFDTYKLDYYGTVYRGKFKGGCRTNFNEAYDAVNGKCDSMLTDR